MLLSAVIPHWPMKPEIHDPLLERCVKSLPRVDEVVVVVNDGIGFAKAVNRGMRLAKGDFIAVLNNDVVWESGNIADLCIPGTVTSPLLNDSRQDFWGCFFVVPRDIYERVGGLDEGYGMAYFEDDDYILTLRAAGIPMRNVDTCRTKSEGGLTFNHLDHKEKSEMFIRNRDRFHSKWNIRT
jgi:GT2 family glycosyltransferase